MSIDRFRLTVPAINRGLFGAFAAIGAAVLVAGLIVAPERAWANVLIAGFALVTAGLAGLLFVAIHHLTGSRWSVVLRRVPEAMTYALPAGAAVLLIVFLFGSSIFSWTEGLGEHGASFKAIWLSPWFFRARAFVYLILWLVFARGIVRASRAQDDSGDGAHTSRQIRLSAGFIVVFVLSFTLASFDWVMSLEPHWYSTIFAVYNFSGLFESGLALIIVFTVWLQTRGPLRGLVTPEHLHDLGKLLFAFSIFWMYIWFSQYMLIWYANLPEEAVRFTQRLRGAWQPLFLANVVLNWLVPFLVLLPVATKRSGSVLAKVSAAVLVGRWLDLYLFVMPAISGDTPVIGPWEIGAALFAIGALALLVHRGLKGAPALPVRDPFLTDSLQHTQ